MVFPNRWLCVVQHVPSLMRVLSGWGQFLGSALTFWLTLGGGSSLFIAFCKTLRELQMEMLYRGMAWLLCWWVLGKHGLQKNKWVQRRRKRSKKVVEKVGKGIYCSLLQRDLGEDVWVPKYSCPWHQDFWNQSVSSHVGFCCSSLQTKWCTLPLKKL